MSDLHNNYFHQLAEQCRQYDMKNMTKAIDLQHCYFHTLSKFINITNINSLHDQKYEPSTPMTFEEFQQVFIPPLMNNYWNHLLEQKLVTPNNVALYVQIQHTLSARALTKHVPFNHPIFNSFFTSLLTNIEQRLRRQIVQHGEAVGMIGAQNISEDSTQKYLKVVHFTGSGASKQFLKSTNALKTILENANTEFQMSFKLKRGHDPNTFGAQIIQTFVKDILSTKHQSYANFNSDTNIVIVTLFINDEIIRSRNKSIHQIIHVLCHAINVHVSACSHTVVDQTAFPKGTTHKCDIAIKSEDYIWKKLYSLNKHLQFSTHHTTAGRYKQFLANNILQDIIHNVIVNGYEGVYAITIKENSVIATCEHHTNSFKDIILNYFNQLEVSKCYTDKLNEFNELFGIVATKHKLQQN